MPRNTNLSLAPAMPANDLRSRAKDRKRDIDSKHKWNPKWAATGVPVAKEGPNGTQRPRAHFSSQRATAKEHQYREDEMRRKHLENKRPVLNDDSSTSQDSSADEDVRFDERPSHVCEGAIEYSYDAARRPARGSQIFGLAVAKAVEKYEDAKIRKLVQDEYDVLDAMSEADDESSYAIADDDDGFELI